MEKKPQLIAKEQEVAELQQLFTDAEAVIITDYRGILVSQDVQLRKQLREAGVEYRVAKNTMIKRAANNFGSTDLDDALNGPTAIAFSKDPVAVAKIISNFIKDNKKTAIKGALLSGKYIDAKGVEDLAKLPSREVLLGKIAGSLAAPMSSFAGVASALLRQLVTVVDQIKEQKSA